MGSQIIKTLTIIWILSLSGIASAHFMPENNLHLEDEAPNDMTEKQFNGVITKAENYYKPIVKEMGKVLEIKGYWSNAAVNANATRYSDKNNQYWIVNMYGGLARRPEINLDSFTMVVCHEIGHHLSGFPLGFSWAANEGQSDYFVGLTCARRLWENETEENAAAAKTVSSTAKKMCDEQWSSSNERHLCYRIINGAASLGALIGKSSSVSIETPDAGVVDETQNFHPKAQCRFDTYVQAALCNAEWDETLIPETAADSARVTCTRADGYEVGVRPLCWFKPKD